MYTIVSYSQPHSKAYEPGNPPPTKKKKKEKRKRKRKRKEKT